MIKLCNWFFPDFTLEMMLSYLQLQDDGLKFYWGMVYNCANLDGFYDEDTENLSKAVNLITDITSRNHDITETPYLHLCIFIDPNGCKTLTYGIMVATSDWLVDEFGFSDYQVISLLTSSSGIYELHFLVSRAHPLGGEDLKPEYDFNRYNKAMKEVCDELLLKKEVEDL